MNFFKPFCSTGTKPIIIDLRNYDVDVNLEIPWYISFEIKLALDMFIFGSLYIALLNFFYPYTINIMQSPNILNFYHYCLISFWGSAILGNSIKYKFFRKT